MNDKLGNSNPFNIVVIVAALGYFVDIYDLTLFGIVRVPSLKAIGIPDDQITSAGVQLLNWQMTGMLIGGIVWGVLGDKKGRLSTLFLTILLYSLANIANGFVQNLEQYKVLRLIAGFGLAGELGIGITLVSEVMTKETRAWGTSIVSAIGIAGAVLAFLIAEWGWKEAYWIGGGLGLALLGLRVYVHESGMFDKVKESSAQRGNFFSLFTNRKRFIKYISCILVGIPVWYVVGILIRVGKKVGRVDLCAQKIDSAPSADAEHGKLARFGVAQVGVERQVFVAWSSRSAHIETSSGGQFYKRMAVRHHEGAIVLFIQRAFCECFHS